MDSVCVHMCEAIGLSVLPRTVQGGRFGLPSQGYSRFLWYTRMCVCLHMHYKVKVKSNWIFNVVAFYIMLSQTLALLPLENQLSKLI